MRHGVVNGAVKASRTVAQLTEEELQRIYAMSGKTMMQVARAFDAEMTARKAAERQDKEAAKAAKPGVAA